MYTLVHNNYWPPTQKLDRSALGYGRDDPIRQQVRFCDDEKVNPSSALDAAGVANDRLSNVALFLASKLEQSGCWALGQSPSDTHVARQCKSNANHWRGLRLAAAHQIRQRKAILAGQGSRTSCPFHWNSHFTEYQLATDHRTASSL